MTEAQLKALAAFLEDFKTNSDSSQDCLIALLKGDNPKELAKMGDDSDLGEAEDLLNSMTDFIGSDNTVRLDQHLDKAKDIVNAENDDPDDDVDDDQ